MYGSSPRARGTREGALIELLRHRIIPARAGNTPLCRFPGQRVSDHPRARGEHWAGADLRVDISGSSPRARGTPS